MLKDLIKDKIVIFFGIGLLAIYAIYLISGGDYSNNVRIRDLIFVFQFGLVVFVIFLFFRARQLKKIKLTGTRPTVLKSSLTMFKSIILAVILVAIGFYILMSLVLSL